MHTTARATVGGHYLTTGALGCFESHVRAWERVVAEGSPAAVFEDDVALRANFDSWMSRVLQSLPVGECLQATRAAWMHATGLTWDCICPAGLVDFGLFYFGNLIGRAIKPALTTINVRWYRNEG